MVGEADFLVHCLPWGSLYNAVSCFFFSLGGEYYIEVFSRRYYRQFESDSLATARDPHDPPPRALREPMPKAPGAVMPVPPPIVSDEEPLDGSPPTWGYGSPTRARRRHQGRTRAPDSPER